MLPTICVLAIAERRTNTFRGPSQIHVLATACPTARLLWHGQSPTMCHDLLPSEGHRTVACKRKPTTSIDSGCHLLQCASSGPPCLMFLNFQSFDEQLSTMHL